MNHSSALSLVALLSCWSVLLPHCAVAAEAAGPTLNVWSAAAAQNVFREDNQPANAEAQIRLRVFIDKSVVEVFVNGRQCVALRVYPGRADSIGVSLRAQGRDAELKSLAAWEMKSIYE